jgi:hypothetical protein
MPHDQPNKEL